MRMRKILACLSTVIIGIGVSLSLFSVKAKAGDGLSMQPTVTIGEKTESKIKTFIKEVNSAVHDVCESFEEKSSNKKSFCWYSGSNITINMSHYKELSQTAKVNVMNAALTAIEKNETLARKDRTKVYNYVAKLDTGVSGMLKELSEETNADFFMASYSLRPFKGWLGTTLGVMAIVIIALLAITLLMDLAYISLPAIQAALTPKEGKKSRFVSREAIQAVKDSEKNHGRSVMGFYFKSKIVQFAFLSICILYLCSGKIFELISNLVDYFNGFVE